MVGYQGVSSRSRSQRQSEANGSATQTGTPRAPARWASAVSGVIRRSRLLIAAAVSAKSSSRRPRSTMGKRPETSVELLGAKALLQAEEVDPVDPGQGLEAVEPERAMAVLLVVRVALPGDADLQSSDRPQLITPPGHERGIGGQVGNLGRNGFQRSSRRSGAGSSRGRGSRTRAVVIPGRSPGPRRDRSPGARSANRDRSRSPGHPARRRQAA